MVMHMRIIRPQRPGKQGKARLFLPGWHVQVSCSYLLAGATWRWGCWREGLADSPELQTPWVYGTERKGGVERLSEGPLP